MFLTLLFFFTSLSPVNVAANTDFQSFNDSIRKYKLTNPQKALDFAFEALDASYYGSSSPGLSGVYAHIGEILNERGLHAAALSYFQISLETFETIPVSERNLKKVNKPPWVLVNIANIYFSSPIKDYKKSKEYNLEAQENFLLYENEGKKQNGLNTVRGNLALIAIVNKNYDLALKYYLKTFESRKILDKKEDLLYSYSQLINIHLRTGNFFKANEFLKTADNLYETLVSEKSFDNGSYIQRNYGYIYALYGAYYQSVKEYKRAIENLNKAKLILIKFPNEIPSITTRLAECYIGLNDLSKAKEIAIENLKVNNLSPIEKKYNYKVLEKIYKSQNLNRELINIKDSIIKLAGFANTNKIIANFNKLETQILLSEKQSELNQNKIRYNTYLFIFIIGTTILFFSLVSIRINYNYQKERNIRLEAVQQVIEVELENKQIELVYKTNFIAQRNEYLEKLRGSIDKEEKDTSESKISRKIKNDINRIIGSEKVFEDFENQFNKVNPDFFKDMLSRFGKLSNTDLRLSAYIKMNQSNSQIAQITGASIRTVESQRYRLSKKLDLTKEDDLNSLIISL